MIGLAVGLLLQFAADENLIRARSWVAKAKPIATCQKGADCELKWARAKDWVRKNTRSAIAVDEPHIFATHGATYATTDLSYALELRPRGDGKAEIAAYIWCGNFFTCAPKPKRAAAMLKSSIGN